MKGLDLHPSIRHSFGEKTGFEAPSRERPPSVVITGAATRTPDLRIMRPQPGSPNVSRDKDLCQEIKAVPHHFPTDLSQMDTGLSAVIEVWDRLPNAVRACIVAIVKAART